MNGVRSGRELIVVFWLCLYIEIGLRVTSLPTLTRRLGITLDVASSDATDAPSVISAGGLPWRFARSDWAVRMVLARGPFPDTCLRRCLLLGQRLRTLGPVLRIGAKRGEDGSVEAHSWLEIRGLSLDPSAPDYVSFSSP